MSVVAAVYTVEWYQSGAWVDITTSVVEVPSVQTAVSTDTSNPLSFDATSNATADVTVRDTVTPATWENVPIRITFSIAGVPTQTFTGLIVGRTRKSDEATIAFACAGPKALTSATKAYSPAYYLRPVATKTHATSVENIVLTTYAGGLINYILWSAGGRPYAQIGSYPGAAFYYDCDQAVLAPTWSWVAGEDGWAEAQKLAAASGGQLYQNALGVVVYRSPFNVVSGTPTFTFDESVYGAVEEATKIDSVVTKAIVSYIPRAARPLQQVVDDTTPRLIHSGETILIVVEPQWPLLSLENPGGQLSTDALAITDLAGTPQGQGTPGYTHTVDFKAQRITITVTNTAGKPIMVWRVTLRGEPITAGEAGNVTVGSGTTERQISDNPYIQSAGHATRLAQLVLLFYGTSRAAVTLSGCVFDPSRTIGEVVSLTVTRWSISAASYLTLSIDTSDTGMQSSYTLCPIANIPDSSAFFLIGPTYSTNHKLGY